MLRRADTNSYVFNPCVGCFVLYDANPIPTPVLPRIWSAIAARPGCYQPRAAFLLLKHPIEYNFTMFPAIFLDRDGVIIENRERYVRSWEDVTFYPESLAALARIHHSPYKIVIVTNQSAVGRGILPISVAEDINRCVVQEIEKAGGRVDGLFMCPHAPQEECACRKPKPGLLFLAAQALSLNLSQSILIGDALSDIEAGQAAGLQKTILLRTGRGAEQARLASISLLKPFSIYDSLTNALADLIP